MTNDKGIPSIKAIFLTDKQMNDVRAWEVMEDSENREELGRELLVMLSAKVRNALHISGQED